MTSTPCAARLSSDMALAAMVETTAVQSEQESAAARARRAEEKMKALKMEVIIRSCHHLIVICYFSSSREWIPSWWKIEMRPWVPV